jgi:hypothetical protein
MALFHKSSPQYGSIETGGRLPVITEICSRRLIPFPFIVRKIKGQSGAFMAADPDVIIIQPMTDSPAEMAEAAIKFRYELIQTFLETGVTGQYRVESDFFYRFG